MKNAKETTKKLLQLITSVRLQNRSIYKKSTVFLYTSNEPSKNKEKYFLYNSIQRIKYLRINLTKDVQNILKTIPRC